MQDKVLLLIGFTAGQIQLIDPIKKKVSKIYNEEVSVYVNIILCIKTVCNVYIYVIYMHCNSRNLFLVAF